MRLFGQTQSNIPGERRFQVSLLGTGASTPTKAIGQGVTVSRTATGVYKLTFDENPGTFARFTWGLGATVPGDVKQHTVTRGLPDSTASVYSLSVSLWNSAGAADDLQATEYMDLEIVYGRIGAGGAL